MCSISLAEAVTPRHTVTVFLICQSPQVASQRMRCSERTQSNMGNPDAQGTFVVGGTFADRVSGCLYAANRYGRRNGQRFNTFLVLICHD